MNNPSTATHVFFSRSQNCVIDSCTDEVPPRGHYGRQTLESYRAGEYPDAEILTWEEAIRIEEDHDRQPVSEITEEKYWEMLEVLPPKGWICREGAESFKMSEHWNGAITGIYARIGERYFHLQDDYRLPHDEIMARCRKFMESHPEVLK